MEKKHVPAVIAVVLAALAAAIYIARYGALQAAMLWAALVFFGGTALVILGTLRWLARVDQHELLRAEEKIQNKDALVIGAFFTLVLLLAYCVAGAAAAMQFPERAGAAVLFALTWALASACVGGGFGFLLGHPRRLTDEKTDRAGIGGLLRTGLDDMVDWLVKGLTTVLLVESGPILTHLQVVSDGMAHGLVGPGAAEPALKAAASFAQPLIVCFTLLGALATCLVTRTYLTGALSRADRTTTGAFGTVGLEFGEVLLLTNAQRFLTTRDLEPGTEIRRVAEKLSALTLADLHSVQEFAMWAKAKSMLKQYDDALRAYEKAVAECDCDAELLLDYGVALHAANKRGEALERLELAYQHLARATDGNTRKNIFKSLTFELLYLPGRFDSVTKLVEEYERDRLEYTAPRSGGLCVNEACAWGQKFEWLAKEKKALKETGSAIEVTIPGAPASWPPEHSDLEEAYTKGLAAVQKAIDIDPSWKAQLRLLLRRSEPKPTELDDLEVFERFTEFRNLVDLPPYSDATATAAGSTERQPSADPSGNVGTEQAKKTTTAADGEGS
jgi:tetratricopeptide (TPR) repeat protein